MEVEREAYAYKSEGLMGCCWASLSDEIERRWRAGEPLTVEGATLRCKYHGDPDDEPRMICRNGYWQRDYAAGI